MKTFITVNIAKLLLLIVPLATVSTIQAQDLKEATLKTMLTDKHFVFKAQTALPLRGGVKNLTSDYDLRLSGDSLVSYLPYFGRAYAVPVDPTEGGLQFISTNFSYDIKNKKKGWDITILPKDTKDVRQLFLNISKNGYGRLQVISNNRDAISFSGYISNKN